MAFLEINGVSKSFGDLCVLRDVNLTVNKGEVVSIIGSSGSGKTTLLRCLNLLESADLGEFLLDGEIMFSGSIGNLSEQERSKRQLKTGLVFQSFNLFPHYSVLDKTKIKKTYSIEIPYWMDSLQSCIAELEA